MDKGCKSKNITASVKCNMNSEIEVLINSDECHVQYGGISSSDQNITSVISENKYRSKCTTICEVLSTLTIEPVVFAFMFGYALNISVLTNMIMDKGCLYYYKYSPEICRNLSGHEAEKYNVEVLAANYSVYTNLLSFLAAFVMMFAAPWSDKYSRKLPLLLAVLGAFLTDVGYICCTVYYDSRLEYVILSKLPTELFGGIICIFMIMFSLASEQSSVKNRSLKYTSVEVAMGMGMSFGGLAGGFLYKYYGYIYVYISSAICHFFGCLWIVLVIEETRGLDIDMTWREKAKDFFVLTSISENLAATFKRRSGNTRCLLLLLMFSMCIIILNYESFGTISYVFVHHVFNWDPTMNSIVTTTFMVIGFLFTLFLVPLFIRVLNFNDFTLGIIGIASMMAEYTLIAFSESHVYIYYAGLSVGILSGLSTLSIRTGISKLVDKDELGRVFSLLATCEAILPMVGTIMLTKVFEATMDTYPNVTYSMTVLWLTVPLLTFIWALKQTRTSFTSLNLSTNNDHRREKN